MFIDKARINIKGGNGGDGSAHFRREKFVPKGGPDGGDGGKGGNVYFLADSHLKTLLDFARRPKHEAQQGEGGKGRQKFGRKGEDMVLSVPCGTVVTENGEVLADMLTAGDKFLIARGGRGGRGNVHFKSSVRQTPRIAERGEPGEARQLQLQLKMIADVGLVGMPNAGKSTLLSRLTRAHPKIANYPFTTLFPNLGVSVVRNREIVFADIPGLIEGSHTGKGLGHEFLRHIERTRILVHMVDPLGFAGKGPKENIKIIQQELKKYSAPLSKKPEIIVINKQDLAEAEPVYKEIKRAFRKRKIFMVSGVSGAGLEDLLEEVAKVLSQHQEIKRPPLTEAAPRITLEPTFWVERVNDLFVVHGKKLEQLVLMTNYDLPEAVQRTQYILKKMGVERALAANGAEEGDPVQIAGHEFAFDPNPS